MVCYSSGMQWMRLPRLVVNKLINKLAVFFFISILTTQFVFAPEFPRIYYWYVSQLVLSLFNHAFKFKVFLIVNKYKLDNAFKVSTGFRLPRKLVIN